jgi:hypothetical protein
VFPIDEAAVDAAAPNPAAIHSGRGPVLKSKFTTLRISKDEMILFGESQAIVRSPLWHNLTQAGHAA